MNSSFLCKTSFKINFHLAKTERLLKVNDFNNFIYIYYPNSKSYADNLSNITLRAQGTNKIPPQIPVLSKPLELIPCLSCFFSLLLDCPSPGTLWSSSMSLSLRVPCQGYERMTRPVHTKNVTKPSPSPPFDLFHDTIYTSPSCNFFVGNPKLPPDVQNSPETSSLKSP